MEQDSKAGMFLSVCIIVPHSDEIAYDLLPILYYMDIGTVLNKFRQSRLGSQDLDL